jgi:hypothetical protein
MDHPLCAECLNPESKHPVDYFVPNQGPDSEILDSFDSLKDTEAKLGAWNVELL